MLFPRRRTTIYWFLLISGILSYITALIAMLGAIYVRWFLNQTFSFLSSFDAIALAIILASQTLALAYVYHSER